MMPGKLINWILDPGFHELYEAMHSPDHKAMTMYFEKEAR